MVTYNALSKDLAEITNEELPWETFKNQTVLITGASGLIGSYLVYTFLKLNDLFSLNIQILALVRNGEKATKQFQEVLNRNDFNLIIQDVTLPLNHDQDIDYIFHAASQASAHYFISDPVGTIKANTVGTINLLDYAVLHNTKEFIYLSSREIYGEILNQKEFIDETDYGAIDSIAIRSCYPESKKLAENICVSYNHQYNITTKIARLAHIYGPDYNIDNGRVWGDFINSIIEYQDIILKSAGAIELSFTYITEAILGIFYMTLKGEVGPYNISRSSEVMSVKDLAELLVRSYPDRNLQVKYNISSENKGYSTTQVTPLNSGKIEGLGWKSTISILEGFQRTINILEGK